MAKILQTRLPLSLDGNVTADTYNRAVRVLELNLNAVDVDQTPQFNQTTIDKSKFRDGDVSLSEGEMYVVPKGVDHKPVAKHECKILVIEPKGVVNTGDEIDDLTINEELWV